MARHLVIVNPNASRVRDPAARAGLIDDLRRTLVRLDGDPPEVIETRAAEETPLAVERGLADGVVGVVGVGGDGTLRAIAEVLAERHTPLAVVPAGSGNQLASALGIPRDPKAAVDALVRTAPRAIDLGHVALELADGQVVESAFIIGCGAGLDARLMATTPASWKRRVGQAAYFLQALRLATRLRALPYRIEIDERSLEVEATVALIGNMGQLAPGLLRPRLGLDPHDGLLDMIVVGATGPVSGLRGLADQMLRTRLGGDSWSSSLRLRGRHIRLSPSAPEPLQVDGDYVGEGGLTATVRPSAVQVSLPAD